jgi:hypothetical protein
MKTTMKKTAAYLLALLLVIQMVPAFADTTYSGTYIQKDVTYRDAIEIIPGLDIDILKVGMENQLTVSSDYRNIVWESDHPEIATVDEDGLVKAVGAGKVTITVISEGQYKDTISFKVVAETKDEEPATEPEAQPEEGNTEPDAQPEESGNGQDKEQVQDEKFIIFIKGNKTKTEYNGTVQKNTYTITTSNDALFDESKLTMTADHLGQAKDCGVEQDTMSETDFAYDGNAEIVVSNGWIQIKPAQIEIKADDITVEEGETPVFTASVTGGLVEGDTLDLSGITFRTLSSEAGTRIVPDVSAGDIIGNYKVNKVESGMLTVNARQMLEASLYNLAKVGNSWYRLRKTTFKVDKPLSEYLNGVTIVGKNVPLDEENYEAADYDFANEILEYNKKHYAYISRRNDTDLDVDGYYTATLNTVETMVAVKSKIGAGNAKTNEGNWLIAQEYRYDDPYATDSFHRNYTIEFYDEIALRNQTVYNMLAIGTATDYYKLKTTTINAIPIEKQKTGAVVNPDSYELEPYDFTNLVLEFDNVKYVYSSDGQEDEYTSYYTVDLENVRREERFNNKENWFTDTTKWLDGASKELFGVTSNNTTGYHANYRATLHKGQERKKSVTIRSNWPEGKPAFRGTKVILTAELEGFAEDSYTLQWEYSTDKVNWNELIGETGMTLTYTLDDVTATYYWRVVANDKE